MNEASSKNGIYFALVAALLFGGSVPLAKLLLGKIEIWLLAGLLYLGSGVLLGLFLVFRRFFGFSSSEASLQKQDWPWLLGAILMGGVMGPLLLLLGLSLTAASTSALLLNFETLATMGIAWVIYRENVDRRLLIGASAILAGSILLSWQGNAKIDWGALAILAACVAWGMDNNLTRRISAADPIQITAIKGLIAGIVNMCIAIFIFGAKLPSLSVTGGAAIIGFLGYGLSIVFFVLALRHLGAARTSAYFSIAPFAGAILSVILFSESINITWVVASLLMALGVWLHVAEHHEHEHVHHAFEHEHRHLHDEHHQHTHDINDPADEPHSHRHHHTVMIHSHPHYPDLHHIHPHKKIN